MRIGPFDTDRVARDIGRAANDVARAAGHLANDVARGATHAVQDVERGAENLAHGVERGVRGAIDEVGRFATEATHVAETVVHDAERAADRTARGALGFIAGATKGIASAVQGAIGFAGSVVDWVTSGLVDFFVKQPRELAQLRNRALAANQGPPAQRRHGSDQEIKDYFDLTSVTYDADRGMPEGWTEVPDAEQRLGVPLTDPDTGLKAKVFEKDGTFVLVFEGTNLTQIEDWETWDPLESTCRHASLSIL